MPNIPVSLRIPANIHEKLVAHTEDIRSRKSEVILTALIQYLEHLPDVPIPVKLTELEKRIVQLEQAKIQVNPRASVPCETLQTFEFQSLTVNAQGEVLQLTTKQATYFSQEITPEVNLEMVAIPSGNFLMGSPETDSRSYPSEKPQHSVSVLSFFLGKYPVTQAQWYSVAQLPKINREINPTPSKFRGDSLPVEQVSWQDALEFCHRLSLMTRRSYRLPSEAEWEYACRGQTLTPFCFGETLTGALANYVSKRVYGEETPQDYPQMTTPVGQFPPNAFGLYDVHGNVWEWCADHWHNHYQGSPTDGSAWLSDSGSHLRVLRGGAWDYYPQDCRSSTRQSCPETASLINKIGFRVACS